MNREEAERIAREVVTGTTPSYVGAALRLASFVLSGDDDEIPETVPEPFRKAEEGESLVAPLGDGPPVLSHPAPPGVPEAFTPICQTEWWCTLPAKHEGGCKLNVQVEKFNTAPCPKHARCSLRMNHEEPCNIWGGNTASLPTIGIDGLRPDVKHQADMHDEGEVGFVPGCDCKKCSDNRLALLRKQEER